MTEIFLVVWSGGYETPQYAAFATKGEAIARALEWSEDLEEEDILDVLCINLDTMEIQLVEPPAVEKGNP